jgi:hypothetical protein
MHTRVILKRYIHNEKRQELIENISQINNHHACNISNLPIVVLN